MNLQDKKLSQCEMCGALMPGSITSGVCQDCWDKDEEMFQKVKTVMRFGERVLPDELSAKTGIEIKHIERWIRQGRFG